MFSTWFRKIVLHSFEQFVIKIELWIKQKFHGWNEIFHIQNVGVEIDKQFINVYHFNIYYYNCIVKLKFTAFYISVYEIYKNIVNEFLFMNLV